MTEGDPEMKNTEVPMTEASARSTALRICSGQPSTFAHR